MSEQLQPAERRILGSIDSDITGPMADFQDPNQEWRQLFSEFYGTFLLVLVAAGGGMMSQAFPNTISRTAAVVAPGLMVMGVIMFMGKISGAPLDPAVSVAFSLRGDFPWRRVPGYVIVQLAGATVAALFLRAVIEVSAYSAEDVGDPDRDHGPEERRQVRLGRCSGRPRHRGQEARTGLKTKPPSDDPSTRGER